MGNEFKCGACGSPMQRSPDAMCDDCFQLAVDELFESDDEWCRYCGCGKCECNEEGEE